MPIACLLQQSRGLVEQQHHGELTGDRDGPRQRPLARVPSGPHCALMPPTAPGGLEARDRSQERALLQAGRQEEGGRLLVGERGLQQGWAGVWAVIRVSLGCGNSNAACTVQVPAQAPLPAATAPRKEIKGGQAVIQTALLLAARRRQLPPPPPSAPGNRSCAAAGPEEAAVGAPHRGGRHLLHHDLLW